jgi:hypothetical protein
MGNPLACKVAKELAKVVKLFSFLRKEANIRASGSSDLMNEPLIG